MKLKTSTTPFHPVHLLPREDGAGGRGQDAAGRFASQPHLLAIATGKRLESSFDPAFLKLRRVVLSQEPEGGSGKLQCVLDHDEEEDDDDTDESSTTTSSGKCKKYVDETPLLVAAEFGNAAVVEQLLDADINKTLAAAPARPAASSLSTPHSLKEVAKAASRISTAERWSSDGKRL